MGFSGFDEKTRTLFGRSFGCFREEIILASKFVRERDKEQTE